MPLTDEDILRDLLHRGTPRVTLPASMATQVVARQRRRDRRVRVVSLAATGAALGTAAGVVALSPGHASHITNPASPVRPAIRLTAAQRVLARLSSAAAGQAAGQGRYVMMTTQGADNGVVDVKNTAVLDGRTGDLWESQKGSDGVPSGAGSLTRHYSPTAAQFAAMPTGLTALRAALIAQWDAANVPAKSETKRTGKREHVPAPDAGRRWRSATATRCSSRRVACSGTLCSARSCGRPCSGCSRPPPASGSTRQHAT